MVVALEVLANESPPIVSGKTSTTISILVVVISCLNKYRFHIKFLKKMHTMNKIQLLSIDKMCMLWGKKCGDYLLYPYYIRHGETAPFHTFL